MASFDLHSRTRAALIHFSGSAAVAALAAALVFLLWFPNPYEAMAGGLGLFVLIISVDIVMGPLITFAVFNRRKPVTELRRDLAIVVLMQLAALAYGLHTMYLARPVALALEEDRFRVVPAVDVVHEELPLAPAPLQSLSLTGPRLLRTTMPTDPAAKFEALKRAITGNDLGTRPKYWQPWDDIARQEVRTNAKPLAQVPEQGPQYHSQAVLAAAVAKTGAPAAQVRFLPLLSRYVAGVVLVDAQTGNVLGFAIFGPA
ncbi:TfpX/TfpZ family type IV pilin accessory protein [Aquabacterium sp.]|uniref:TfpX/TfpZ family type IV pilin accessory protein n=1 Tax=Aquabacterium sp. TaxID=1872578 RepID=UPI002BBBCFDF|nr:TfpX/TfpZ family type IV pilin accessory protein [Aquabacterium sp.]HSW08633.1 TfpX/TfpZ family type IV pilin accessory protein [Aquabacterium sp.]